MAVNANDLRRGQAVNYNGDISVVLDVQHRTPGNLRAFVQATLRSIRTGKSADVRFSSTEKVETVPMMTKKMEFSYKDGEDFVFTDPENYETVTLIPELVALGLVRSVSTETVRQALKKTTLSHGSLRLGASRPRPTPRTSGEWKT